MIIGNLFLGLLVGVLAGLSGSEIAQAIVAGVLACAGAFLTAFAEKHQLRQAVIGKALASFALAGIVGVFAGAIAHENKFLASVDPVRSVGEAETITADSSIASDPYLKRDRISQANLIDLRFRAGEISGEEAYRQLRSLTKGGQ